MGARALRSVQKALALPVAVFESADLDGGAGSETSTTLDMFGWCVRALTGHALTIADADSPAAAAVHVRIMVFYNCVVTRLCECGLEDKWRWWRQLTLLWRQVGYAAGPVVLDDVLLQSVLVPWGWDLASAGTQVPRFVEEVVAPCVARGCAVPQDLFLALLQAGPVEEVVRACVVSGCCAHGAPLTHLSLVHFLVGVLLDHGLWEAGCSPDRRGPWCLVAAWVLRCAQLPSARPRPGIQWLDPILWSLYANYCTRVRQLSPVQVAVYGCTPVPAPPSMGTASN